MTRTITTREYEALWEEALHNGETAYHSNGFEAKEKLPQRLGRGGYQFTQLRNGLSICIQDQEFWHPLHLESFICESEPLLSSFYLSGSHRAINPSLKTEAYRVESSNQNCLFFAPGIKSIDHYPAQQQLLTVYIITEIDFLKSFSQGCPSLAPLLRQLIEGTPERFHQSFGMTTPAMQQALHQIIQCPYHGITKQIYLEGKALELLALQFAQSVESDYKLVRPSLRRDDIERLHRAKDILISNLENPPSLLDLAQQVGLSDRKLKQGFRQIFNTTVFGYLHDYWMEKARQLLQEDTMTIAEVSYTVGFANRGYFAAAFRRKFGVNPSAYLAQSRKNRRYFP